MTTTIIKWESHLATFATRKHHYAIRKQFIINGGVITGSTFVPAAGGQGLISCIDVSGQGLTSLIDETGQGLNSAISESFGVISLIDDSGQGLTSLINTDGQGVESDI